MKFVVAALSALLLLSAPANAQGMNAQQAFRLIVEAAQGRAANSHAVLQRDVFDGDELHIIDGDTFGIGCDARGKNCVEKIRLKDVDTPETYDPKCRPEYEAGLRAKARFASLLRGKIRIERLGPDPHDRTLAKVYVVGGEVGEIMIREGVALSWRPGGRAKAERIAHWCGPGNW
jgi:endonuclease YncB( thermonuclease family)